MAHAQGNVDYWALVPRQVLPWHVGEEIPLWLLPTDEGWEEKRSFSAGHAETLRGLFFPRASLRTVLYHSIQMLLMLLGFDRQNLNKVC